MTPKYESEFTQRVIEAIENARLDAGISVQEIIENSGIRRSSYFRKMRGETTFTTEDMHARDVADYEVAEITVQADSWEAARDAALAKAGDGNQALSISRELG